MSLEIQTYLVYSIVLIAFYLFTKPIWDILISLVKPKKINFAKETIYHKSCSKCKI